MRGENESTVTEFILIGVPREPLVKITFFAVFLVLYLLTLIGNGLLILLTRVDPQLHTPMYFFLSNLSFLDICYTTSTVPQMLAHCLSKTPSISLNRCFIQMYISLFLGTNECLLLAAMAYDHWVAVCNPLRYTLIMNSRVCISLMAMVWSGAFFLCIFHPLTMRAHFCGPNLINHFACELLTVLKLACSNSHGNQTLLFSISIFTLLVPLTFILITYTRIIAAVLRIRSAEGRAKAFSTCTSHLTVVTVFFGTTIFMYLCPQSQSSPDQDKYISLFYGAITPMLNPLVYSLRNKDLKGAMKKLAGRKMNS